MFWSLPCLIVCVQYPVLLTNETTGERESYNTFAFNPLYDPWKDDPWNFDIHDRHHSMLEAIVTLLGFFYGMLRLVNMIRIGLEDESEARWNDFWSLCEDLSS